MIESGFLQINKYKLYYYTQKPCILFLDLYLPLPRHQSVRSVQYLFIYLLFFFSVLGFHLSASVVGQQNRIGAHNVAVTFDRRRISSCNCTCNSSAYWCSHVVAVCLTRIHWVSIICSARILYRCLPSFQHFLHYSPLSAVFFFRLIERQKTKCSAF